MDLRILIVTRLAASWSPFAPVSALYCYYERVVLRFVRYHLVFDHHVWKFIFIYAALTHSDKNIIIFFVIAFFTAELTMLILHKYGFKVSVILFGFYSTRYKAYIHLPWINTQKLKSDA